MLEPIFSPLFGSKYADSARWTLLPPTRTESLFSSIWQGAGAREFRWPRSDQQTTTFEFRLPTQVMFETTNHLPQPDLEFSNHRSQTRFVRSGYQSGLQFGAPWFPALSRLEAVDFVRSFLKGLI